MPIEFSCASCGTPQKADDHLAGRELRCHQCGGRFTVPITMDSSAVLLPDRAAEQVSGLDWSSTVDL